MSDLRDLLTAEEKAMMNDYVTAYATNGNEDHAPIDYLLRCWATEKKNLYKLLGNQFQITKTLTYDKSLDKLREEMCAKFADPDNICFKFRRQFDRFLWDNRRTLGDDYYRLIVLMDEDMLINTSYDGDEFSVYTPEGRTIKVQKGCRPMRIFSKLAKAYNALPSLTDFQNEVSIVLTQKHLTGRMTLSIHPMDYMTMSDNDMGWSSCMNWPEEGCYRRGTVEMMNSPMVVVAFLASDEDMEFSANRHDYTWNNKKWRELFIVDKKVITGIKGYPYQNSDLVKSVNSWLKELAEKNLGWHYDTDNIAYKHRQFFNYESLTTGATKHCRLEFYTNTMYNDFGTLNEHYGIIGCANGDHDTISLNYSGNEMCLMCGSTDEGFLGEGELMCMSCSGRECCSDCGDCFDTEDLYELDGRYYCRDCYYNHCVTDALTGDDHDRDNMFEVYLISNKDAEKLDSSNSSIFDDSNSTYIYAVQGRTWDDYFNAPLKCAHIGWGQYNYVTPSMFKNVEDMQEVFNLTRRAYERYLED